jgi:glucosamine--fructose-6-phosphate aminotransferase (isomerizing)
MGVADTNGLATIGRGPTLAIAREAALKLKETCNLHAEAFSFQRRGTDRLSA